MYVDVYFPDQAAGTAHRVISDKDIAVDRSGALWVKNHIGAITVYANGVWESLGTRAAS